MLPDLSVLWIVGLVLLLAVILDRLMFRPLMGVMKAREDAAASARKLADRAADEARAATREFERRTAEARGEVYRQMDEMRRVALAERAALVEDTRREADKVLADARAQLDQDVAAARGRLDAEADVLGAEAASRILGRSVS